MGLDWRRASNDGREMMGAYDRYICTKLMKRDMLPGPTPEERDRLAAEGLRIRMEHVLWIDSDVIPGAYYGESTWIWPESYPRQVSQEELARRTTNQKPMFAHVHDFPELLSWWGTDPDHPEDTSDMGLIMDDEEIWLNRSWVAYIPAGVKHMPTRKPGARVSGRPVFHWTSGPGSYTREGTGDKDDGSGVGQATSPERPVGGFSRYIVYGYQPGARRPEYMRHLDPRYTRPVAYIDKTVIPDAEFGCDTMWLLPGDGTRAGQVLMDEHVSPHGTSIVLNAMNYPDITDLCAEAELWIGGEKHIVKKSFGAYVPPRVRLGPLKVRNIAKPLFFMMSHPIGTGVEKYRGS
jgi:hypothetical protein